MAVNSLVGIPTIKVWKSLLDFNENTFIARGLHTQFPLIYKSTKHRLPPGVMFSAADFVPPFQGLIQNVTALLTNLGVSLSYANDTASTVDENSKCIVTQTTSDGTFVVISMSRVSNY